MTDYVALVFTDLVNSTGVKNSMPGRNITERNQAFRDNILFLHRKRVTESLNNYGGRVVEPPQGDGYLLEFADPVRAIEWAVFIQRSHEEEPINTPSGALRVKVGMHYGAPLRDGDRFIGQEVDYASRVAALHKEGGKILLSETMGVLIKNAKIHDIEIRSFGEGEEKHELQGIGNVPVWEVIYYNRLKGDYDLLQSLLAEKSWKEADRETMQILLRIADTTEKRGRLKPTKKGWLTEENVKKIPIESLQAINNLWLAESHGKFGYSVQKQIWLDVTQVESIDDSKVIYNNVLFGDFADRVGWQLGGHWKSSYDDFNFSLDAPDGHLPTFWFPYSSCHLDTQRRIFKFFLSYKKFPE